MVCFTGIIYEHDSKSILELKSEVSLKASD